MKRFLSIILVVFASCGTLPKMSFSTTNVEKIVDNQSVSKEMELHYFEVYSWKVMIDKKPYNGHLYPDSSFVCGNGVIFYIRKNEVELRDGNLRTVFK